MIREVPRLLAEQFESEIAALQVGWKRRRNVVAGRQGFVPGRNARSALRRA
jgi:hypothetical protein